MAFSAAADLEQARVLAARAAAAIQSVGNACDLRPVSLAGIGLSVAALAPLPPEWSTIRGGAAALYAFDMGTGGQPTRMEGTGVLTFGDSGPVVTTLKRADAMLRNLTADGTPLKLPDMPFAANNYLAATATTIAAGLGDGSDEAVASMIGNRPGPAPLASMTFDFRGFSGMIEESMKKKPSPDNEVGLAMVRAMGRMQVDLTTDQHGVALWVRMALPSSPAIASTTP
jgi:hypothetical protein